MQFERQMRRKSFKIRIGGEDFQPVPDCLRTNQQVEHATLNAFAAAGIVTTGGILIVLLIDRQIWKEAQIISKPQEALVGLCAGEKFLAYAAEHLNRRFAN